MKKASKKGSGDPFEEHGGYMAVKMKKLEERFLIMQKDYKKSDLFEGKMMKI